VELFRTEAKGRPHTLLLVTKGGSGRSPPCATPNPARTSSFRFDQQPRGSRGARERRGNGRGTHGGGEDPRAQRVEDPDQTDPMMDGYAYDPIADRIRQLAPERVTLGCLRAEAGLLKVGDPRIFSGMKESVSGDGLARYPERSG